MFDWPDLRLGRDTMLVRIGIATPTEPFRAIFERYFRAAGFEVLRLPRPKDSVDSVKAHKMDLMVVDCVLMNEPGGDWKKAARAVSRASIPVIAAGPMEDKEKLLEDTTKWAEALITYPMNPEVVLHVIERVLRGKGQDGEASQDIEERSDDTLVRESPARWPERVVARVLREQPALGAIEASRAVLDQISDAIFIFARTGEMILVNETACRMLGYDRDEILGRSAGVVFAQIENPPLVEGLDLRQAMSRFAVPPFDTILRAASGQSIEVSFGTSFLRDEHDNVIGTLGIAREICERKRLEEQLLRHNEILEEEVQARTEKIRASESKYRSLLEQIPFAVICTDTEGCVTSFNGAARRLFDWDDKAIGSGLFGAWDCQDCEAPKACHTAVKSQSVWAGECVMKLTSGSKVTLFHTCSQLFDGAGRVIGIVHAVSDLSDPSAAQLELMHDAHGLVICDSDGNQKIVTRSSKMRDVLDLIATCANTSATVLIEGESGTGKDLVARAFHLNSDRADGPYLVINCATLDEHFLKSELFGHERGAFTGAVMKKQGLLEVADGGTLFIDEVGDMSPEVQAMMLRVLETGNYRRMGSTAEEHVNVRIIAATNKDLEEEVDAGRFRQDLFYRLNVIRILLPPLRERPEDIRLLAEHFLQESSAVETERPVEAGDGAEDTGIRWTKRFSADAMKLLTACTWPGNVRELRNVVEQARILSKGSRIIGPGHLPQLIAQEAKMATRAHKLFKNLAEIEEAQIRKVLKALGGNRTKAAKVLGISRTTLISKIRKYEL